MPTFYLYLYDTLLAIHLTFILLYHFTYSFLIIAIQWLGCHAILNHYPACSHASYPFIHLFYSVHCILAYPRPSLPEVGVGGSFFLGSKSFILMLSRPETV
jgi:hypothetical protein